MSEISRFGKFPLKITNFQKNIPHRSKKSYRAGQKMSGAKMGWSRIFTVGQKNARVGSGAHLFYCLKIKEPFIVQFTLDGY